MQPAAAILATLLRQLWLRLPLRVPFQLHFLLQLPHQLRPRFLSMSAAAFCDMLGVSLVKGRLVTGATEVMVVASKEELQRRISKALHTLQLPTILQTVTVSLSGRCWRMLISMILLVRKAVTMVPITSSVAAQTITTPTAVIAHGQYMR